MTSSTSASYPLVRNFSDFATRRGVSAQALARRILAQLDQQLLDQVFHGSSYSVSICARCSRPLKST